MIFAHRMRASVLFVILLILSRPAAAQTTVVRAARLLDVATGVVQRPGLILVEGSQIRAVGSATVPPGATVIDVGDATLHPGLIDSHTHLQDEPGSNSSFATVKSHASRLFGKLGAPAHRGGAARRIMAADPVSGRPKG